MRRGGETDLVVDHDMHGAAGAVAADARKLEALGHDALARKGRVTMEQDRHDRAAVAITKLVLLGADLAQHDGVHRFEVAGVGGQAEVDSVAVEFAVG